MIKETSPPPLSLKKRFILVAEDSPINQQIAEEFLCDLDVDFEIVSNGQEALEAMLQRQPDLILMDLQMPVLDGFEATRIIRASSHYSHIPIVAMTADADDAQKQACLDVGMNDHIVKSISPEPLYKAIDKWLPETNDDVDCPSSINWASIKRNVKCDKGLLRRLLQSFREQHGQDIQKIEDALERGDEVLAKRIVHTLVSISGSVGAEALFQEVCQLNAEWKSEDAILRTSDLIVFNREFSAFMQELDDFFDTQSQNNISDKKLSPFEKEVFALQLDKLAQQLLHYSPDAALTCASMFDMLLPDEMFERLQKINTALDVFDFDTSQKLLNGLTEEFFKQA